MWFPHSYFLPYMNMIYISHVDYTAALKTQHSLKEEREVVLVSLQTLNADTGSKCTEIDTETNKCLSPISLYLRPQTHHPNQTKTPSVLHGSSVSHFSFSVSQIYTCICLIYIFLFWTFYSFLLMRFGVCWVLWNCFIDFCSVKMRKKEMGLVQNLLQS